MELQYSILNSAIVWIWTTDSQISVDTAISTVLKCYTNGAF